MGIYHSKTVQTQNFSTGGAVKAKILRLDVSFVICFGHNDYVTYKLIYIFHCILVKCIAVY